MIRAILARRRCLQVFHGVVLRIDPDWRESFERLGLYDPLNWRVPTNAPPVSHSKKAVACYRMPLADGRVMYFKRYDYRHSLKHRLRFWMRPSRAGVEQFGYTRYRRLGIETPRIVGFGEHRKLGTLVSSFIATEEVPGSTTLKDFVESSTPAGSPAGEGRKLTDFAARLLVNLRRAHAAYLFHYDLKWRNILIQQRDGEYYPVIIDCPRAFVSRLRRRYGITADLSALARVALSCLSLYQRYRLLAAYLGEAAGPAERKYWYRRVQRHYERRASKSAIPRDSVLKGVHFAFRDGICR
ncbi:MAG TPA: lipopolysaccharide kinase InaA family protein [Gammaproteobacteria bacterium]|nr:lipopolysaccharide kinase InaA family protein [Gammaproteobacteria bacterium]